MPSSLRRALALIAAVWLVAQLTMMVVTPVAIWTHDAIDQGVECTCAHGDEATCPMHHHPSSGSKVCVMQNAGIHATIPLTSLFSVAGFARDSHSTAVLALRAAIVAADGPSTIAHPVPPDPPPPRA